MSDVMDITDRARRLLDNDVAWDDDDIAVVVADLVAEIDQLRTAIQTHKDAVKCCDECADALVQPREMDEPWNHDGRLWAAARLLGGDDGE